MWRNNVLAQLNDNEGRHFSYLRLSVTDVCNFRCDYCLPSGCASKANDFLSLDEIRRLVTAFAECGVQKVRLTGGEPTVRKDFTQVAKVIGAVPGIQTCALTTNGYQLERRASEYYQAGINALNVSVDSLDPAVFHQLTGHDCLGSVLLGIQAAQAAGFASIKVNVVLLKGVNDQALANFLRWIKTEPLTVRFIELMQTGENQAYFDRHHVSTGVILTQLQQANWQVVTKGSSMGPALEFAHPDYKGRVGLIGPYSTHFCQGCNRLRVSAQGDFHLCLFGDERFSLRSLLKNTAQKAALKEAIVGHLQHKKPTQFQYSGDLALTPYLAAIGG